MKIEIEFEDVEYLRKKVSSLENEIKQLNQQIKEANVDALKQKAVDLSRTLFDKYMAAVFEKLGFEVWHNESVVFPPHAYELGKRWWESDKLEISVAANVCESFKRAYLRIGVIPPVEIDNQETKQDLEL